MIPFNREPETVPLKKLETRFLIQFTIITAWYVFCERLTASPLSLQLINFILLYRPLHCLHISPHQTIRNYKVNMFSANTFKIKM